MSNPAKTPVQPTKGKGTVAAIAMLFLVSAGIRLLSGAEVVFAGEGGADSASVDVEVTRQSNQEKPSVEQLDVMLRAFEEREARIRQQELKIDKRMKALNVADMKINERLAELKMAEEQLRSTLALASTAAEDDLARLTAVYENMKPKTAAQLFEEMSPEFAAGFLGRMRPEIAAAIMAGMKPESAYSVSAILAGRNANVPKQ